MERVSRRDRDSAANAQRRGREHGARSALGMITLNKGSAGKTYPVKVQVRDEGGDLVTRLDAISSIKYKPVTCGSFTGDPTDALETTATGGTSLRFDGEQFVYNWKTPTQSGCYELFVTLGDGGVYKATSSSGETLNAAFPSSMLGRRLSHPYGCRSGRGDSPHWGASFPVR